MLVSDGVPQACRSQMGHVSFRSGVLVSDGACQSPMKRVEGSIGSSIRHVGLPLVFDNNIFVNSFHAIINIIIRRYGRNSLLM